MTSTRRYTVSSATIRGSEAIPVSVEVVVSAGMPGFSIVGMPDVSIHEARERVRAAIRSCGLKIPADKIVFNLAPGYLKKTGSGFDLPMALALLAATGQIPSQPLEGKLIVGELSLDGTVKQVNGLVAFQMCAFDSGLDLLCSEAFSAVEGLSTSKHVYTCKTLRSFINADFGDANSLVIEHEGQPLDFADVGGHRVAKRAMQIAAAGGHGLLMVGPPGSGKSMLAKRLPSILPSMNAAEIGESARIASIVGDPIEKILNGERPFRSPHHSATLAGLVGGGNPVRPGEVSLAHNGVLMLDELPEFSNSVLQGLRQPMEDGKVTITRADGNVTMPAHFSLVATSNPCPCGYFGDAKVKCNCSPAKVQAYQNRIGGPLIDRIDMSIDVWRSDFDEVIKGDQEYTSARLKEGVVAAREFRSWRMDTYHTSRNTPQTVGSLLDECAMDTQALSYFKKVAQSCVLSGRGIVRVLRVARTIADIEQSERVLLEHLAEASTLRVRTALDVA